LWRYQRFQYLSARTFTTNKFGVTLNQRLDFFNGFTQYIVLYPLCRRSQGQSYGINVCLGNTGYWRLNYGRLSYRCLCFLGGAFCFDDFFGLA
jgi:hypothetical protein